MNLTYSIAPNMEAPQLMFSWIDYTLFTIMLGVSGLIGIYYGCCGSKQNTVDEYLIGGKTMRVFPIAMSLVVSHTSGIAILSAPADVYKFGGTYWWISIGIIVSSIASAYVFLPVFSKLQITSTYEYLQLRFNNKIRIFASFLYFLWVFLFNPIVIYVPALAFEQVTGIQLYYIIPIVCIVCVFYTTIGGLKAVVWTDTLQSVVMVGSMMTVFILGIIAAGGFSNIWTKSVQGQRLDIFDFNTDPTRRDTFWVICIGSSALWIKHICISQGTFQRCMAVPSIHHARRVLLTYCIGIVLLKTVCTLIGLILYTKYSDCDPLSTKQVLRNDQLLPYFVMDVAGKIPGLPGLFISGVFSAGLSTLSTTLNSLSGTIYEDFMSPFMPANISQKQASNILKLIVLVLGVISTLLVFVVQHLGGILPLTLSIGGITGAPFIGLFCLGMLFPCANSNGALVGGIVGLMFSTWMVIGNQISKQMGLLEDFSKPSSVDGCNFYVNATSTFIPPPDEPAFVLYRITFWYYDLLGAIVVIIVGVVVSLFTNKNAPPIHPDLISPVIHFLLPRESTIGCSRPLHDYSHSEKTVHLLTLNSEKENDENT